MKNRCSAAAFAAARLVVTVTSLLATALAAQEAPKPEEKKTPVVATAAAPGKLEAFEVTGTRIKRLDYETVSPVATFSAAAIEEKGYVATGETVS